MFHFPDIVFHYYFNIGATTVCYSWYGMSSVFWWKKNVEKARLKNYESLANSFNEEDSTVLSSWFCVCISETYDVVIATNVCKLIFSNFLGCLMIISLFQKCICGSRRLHIEILCNGETFDFVVCLALSTIKFLCELCCH